MRHSIILLLLFFLGISELYSQSDFRKGYIVKKNNDAINGLIDYKGNIANSKKCIFKSNVSSDNQIFTPDDITAYRFDDSKYYISKTVIVNGEEKKMFLEYLINGIVDLYYYHDELGKHYLVDKGDGNLSELKNEEKEVILNDKRYLRKSKEYIRLLKEIFIESPTISKQVDNLSLNHRSLIKVTHDFHNEVCKDEEECIIYERKLSKAKIKYGLLIGLNSKSISGTDQFDDALYYFRDSQFGTAIFPSFGFFFKSNIPYLNERLFIQYEGIYSRMNFESTYSTNDPVYNWTYTNTIKFTRSVFGNNIYFKYEFPQGKIRPTFQIGGFANFALQTDYQRSLEVVDSFGEPQTSDEFTVSPFKKFEAGINLGFGFNATVFNEKELFFELNYQRGSGLLPKLKGLNSNMYSVNIGYQLGK